MFRPARGTPSRPSPALIAVSASAVGIAGLLITGALTPASAEGPAAGPEVGSVVVQGPQTAGDVTGGADRKTGTSSPTATRRVDHNGVAVHYTALPTDPTTLLAQQRAAGLECSLSPVGVPLCVHGDDEHHDAAGSGRR